VRFRQLAAVPMEGGVAGRAYDAPQFLSGTLVFLEDKDTGERLRCGLAGSLFPRLFRAIDIRPRQYTP